MKRRFVRCVRLGVQPWEIQLDRGVHVQGNIGLRMATTGQREIGKAHRVAKRSESERLDEELQRLAGQQQTSVTLKATVETGQGLLLPDDGVDSSGLTRRQRTLIQIASFLRIELPVRLARRAVELKRLPEGMHAMPSVNRVREWYEQSFVEIRRSPFVKCPQTEEKFSNLLHTIYERHSPTMVTMARGVYELKQQLQLQHGPSFDFGSVNEVHGYLDKFYMSRIGIRILIGQYLELRRQSRESQVQGYVGLINLHTSPATIAEQAIADAKYLCKRTHGHSPEVLVVGRSHADFSYMPSHLYYSLFELIKNSLRAVVEFHGVDSTMPPIKVIISDGELNEDVVIKVADEGGGIPRSNMPQIFSYLFTTAKPVFKSELSNFSSLGDHSTDSPLAGLGYGLPISRTYARYFGGDLNIMSMEGYGTDAFLHLCRLGNRSEPLP
mmetsp:Transcript_26370/g.43820  ORF Transcript_26370/g.43820 Transcript_26370/m.43820 type:complete len:440 (+) Transcript_26370:74-1393(+)